MVITPTQPIGPSDLTDVNSTLFFVASGGSTGSKLWKSDGTPQGTVIVKDIDPSSLTNVNGTLFFSAYDGIHGEELWKSDGTDAGTVQVKDINPGSGSFPAQLVNVNGVLYFSADDGQNGGELWTSDGTDPGTVMVKDICPGTCGSWIHSVTQMNGTAFFEANDGVSGYELWKSDGTVTGTVLVMDVLPGPMGSSPHRLTACNNLLFFVANDYYGDQLWRSDGTSAGTYELTNSSVGDFPFNLTASAGALYFFYAEHCTLPNGYCGELWKSDGTLAGTFPIAGTGNEAGSSSPSDAVMIGSTLYFAASDGLNGVEPWTSDGTATGTTMLKDIWTGAGDSQPSWFTEVNGLVFFSAADAAHGQELWVTDGTESGTRLVIDISLEGSGSYPQFMRSVNGLLLFSARDVYSGLWRSDGTEAGTFVLHPIRYDGGLTFVDSPNYVFNGELYFQGNDGVHGIELWKSDGTFEGTFMLKDMNPGPGDSISGFDFVAAPLGSAFYFPADDGATGYELWKTDGTEAGTVQVRDIYPGPDASGIKPFSGLGSLFMGADDGSSGNELWKSDGTQAGTGLLADIFPGSNSSFPNQFTEAGGFVYFSAFDETHGWELWKTDGTFAGTSMVQDITPGPGGLGPQGIAGSNGTAFFSTTDGVHGLQPWRSQGTPATTIMEEVEPADVSSVPRNFVAGSSLVYFTAYDDAHGVELWALPVSTSPDFLIGCASPPPVVVGHSVQTSCEVRSLASFAGTVNLSCSNLPAGVSCSFSSPTVVLSGDDSVTVDLTLSTDFTAPLGSSTIRISAGDALLTRYVAKVVEVVEIALFYDNFDDGDASDWIPAKGTWSVVNGYLTTTTSTSGSIYSPVAFAGCSLCSVEADLRAETPGAIVSLIGWHQNKGTYVELDLLHKKNKIVLKQKASGSHTKKAFRFTLSAGIDYVARMEYDGVQLNVFVNHQFLFSAPALGSPTGNLGLRVKSPDHLPATGSFKQVQVSSRQ